MNWQTTSSDYSYGLFTENCLLTPSKGSNGSNFRTAFVGQIVKINGTQENGRVLVKMLKDAETWESHSFICKKDNLIPIKEKLVFFIAAISPQERLKLAKNKEKCEKLSTLTKEMTVAVSFNDDVALGVIKYIGTVKGIGKCIGIQLHERREKNKCDGSCAGIQYFNCSPGYGVFSTIEKINPINKTNSKEPQKKSDQDLSLEKSISNLFLRDKEFDTLPKYEEIITKYGEYSNMSNKSTTYIRNSLSLQNILEIDKTLNSNNDFDNNTIIPPDKTYLMHESDAKKKIKNKSELDLIDIVGNSPHEYRERNGDCNGTFKKANGVKIDAEVSKHAKNRSVGMLTQVADSSTAPRKKVVNDLRVVGGSKKINEKSEALAKACTSKNCDKPRYVEPQKGTTHDLSIGSLVEISNDVTDTPLYGVIRWMGIENGTNFILVGVELEEDLPENLPLMLTDGSHNGEKLFKCLEKRALFVPIQQCHKDSRFMDGLPTPVHQPSEKLFDDRDCPIIKGCVAPLCMPTEEDVEAVCGKYRGIQGHHNSCYLDVTLFSMFTYTAVFDSLLFRPKSPNDIVDYEEVQRVLREEIVNPLRKNLYVSAGHVMNLRKLLDRLSSVSGLTSEEKDPEEFLNSLLAQILRAEPFLKLNSGQEAFYYQLFVEKDAQLTLPTVQQLFEQSFLTSNIKLKEVPSCLIIQMPRFGKSYKMYPRILPSQLLDVTDVIEESPRQCIVCGKLARYECRECFDFNNAGLASTAFCEICLKTAHRHEKRINHLPVPLEVSYDYTIMENHVKPPRLFMELFAVICIETSHYVAFVKCGVGHEAPWCFFDSMADRKGERNGYNIPEMVACPDISRWLSDEGVCRQLHEEYPNDRYLPEHARRLLCDAYICMYQSSDVMMYR
ncbi:hypothetical protein HHI36_006019 [Cryptolaemus montrouzieri]|uniref:ubiquitinyl hydrolase 1 n=1 Tax=Cryptolaemus montrouzieri TaxID=559131 RepID=A0ABD2NVY9_9CUCU